MLDPLLTPAFILHMATLLAFWFWGAKRLGVTIKDAPFVVFVSFWTTLVFTSHLAGIGKHLGDLSYYVPLSVLSTVLLYRGLFLLNQRPSQKPVVQVPHLDFDLIENEKVKTYGFWFLIATLGLFALISLVLAVCVYPDNADSIIYRLPRAFWYVSHGSFMHPFESIDKRLVFYPLNGVSLYVPFILYGLPGNLQGLPSFFCWVMVVYTTYRFARSVGANRGIALLSAWIIGLTPSILAQATSTNDEILAASALLVGLYLAWQFLLTGRGLYFLMAGMGVGLSAGTKLHIVFLLPMIAILLCVAVFHLFRYKEKRCQWSSVISLRLIIETGLMMLILFAPFLFYNFASTGRFYFLNDFKGDVFNLGASMQGGLQNLLIYLSQMIISPIADLNMWPVANDRQAFNVALNRIFYPLLSAYIDPTPSFYHMAYRFVGVVLPVSVRFVEFSLWAAFVWLLWPWQVALIAARRFTLRPVFLVLALTPAIWLFFWSFSTLYMEGTATYFSFYLIVAAPAMAMTFLKTKKIVWGELRWIFALVVVVTNLIVAHNLVMYSGFRALPDLVYAKRLPYDWLLMEQPIVEEIRRAKNIRVAFTHEKQPYFAYMHWNPRATFFTPYAKAFNELPADTLHILPMSSLYAYGFAPLKIPGKRVSGATYLGLVRGIGREAIFAIGNNVEKRHPLDSNYVLLGTAFSRQVNGLYVVTFGGDPAGLYDADELIFDYTLRRDDRVLFHRAAQKDPSFKIYTEQNPQEDHLVLDIHVRDALSGKTLVRTAYGIGGSGAWLPEGAEY